MEILSSLYSKDVWQDFLQYKTEKQHISKTRQKELTEYIREGGYLPVLDAMKAPDYGCPVPAKKEINKGGVSKKRVVYSFPEDFGNVLKIIAWQLYKYDDLFADNCYAFRRNHGVRNAMKRILRTRDISAKYCLKVDISNYFNSIDVPLLLKKLVFLKGEDAALYRLFETMLSADKAWENGQLITEKRGAMAGTPVSPFFANVYLMDVDWYFEERGVLYFRYSDDILIFANSLEELQEYRQILYRKIEEHHLKLNPARVHISAPRESWEFLGFCYDQGEIDLSANTIQKMKDKIRRKAKALRRWQSRKGLTGEKAAKGFIKAMNHKFFDSGDGTEFSWSRWFFPNLTTDRGLREIDGYMQQYIRYCVTGRHYKGNFRIPYEQLKEWGYRNLVHEFYDTRVKRSELVPACRIRVLTC